MKVKTLGIDVAKDVFGVHGVDARGKTLVHKRVTRKHLRGLLAKLEPCLVGMEACGSAHHWALTNSIKTGYLCSCSRDPANPIVWRS